MISSSEDTPAETPMGKRFVHDSHHLLLKVLEHFNHRLSVIDHAQTYIIEEIERVYDAKDADTLSIIRAERVELASRAKTLLRQLEESYHFDDGSDRPSRTNITVENFIEPTRRSSLPTFGSAKFRRVVILIALSVAGSIIGFVWAIRALHLTSSTWPAPSTLRKEYP